MVKVFFSRKSQFSSYHIALIDFHVKIAIVSSGALIFLQNNVPLFLFSRRNKGALHIFLYRALEEILEPVKCYVRV